MVVSPDGASLATDVSRLSVLAHEMRRIKSKKSTLAQFIIQDVCELYQTYGQPRLASALGCAELVVESQRHQ